MKFLPLLLLLLSSCILCAQENTALLCADGIDNDGDGDIDCADRQCASLAVTAPCDICPTGGSFADVVLEYSSGCPASDPQPEGILGVADWIYTFTDSPEAVFLGINGYIKLGFTNNLLTNSATDAPDLWIFEIGDLVEPTDIALRPVDAFTQNTLMSQGITDTDADGYYEFATVGGATTGLDIDAQVSAPAGLLLFDAVKITDSNATSCDTGSPGADIDAVCAISSVPIDCNGTLNGTAILDLCGECLEADDPNFNQSCADCAGVPNGSAVTDACGVCLESDDPSFNQSCTDCAGSVNGSAVIDDCGVCLEPTDPTFNQSCTDCAGVPNGTAVLDLCGDCLPPDSPDFNAVCLGEKKIFIPDAFSPNDDGVNDFFGIFKEPNLLATVVSYRIFDRWGGLVFEKTDFAFSETENFWRGDFNGKEADEGVFVYVIEIQFGDGTREVFSSDVSLLR